MKNPKPNKKEEVTPQQQIEKFDNRMNEIDKEISSLRTEREALMRRRSSLFYSLDIPCELKYEFIESDNDFLFSRECRFYIEIDGRKEIFLECGVYLEATPDNLWLRKIPEKYKNDFIMLWEKAHREEVEHYNQKSQESYEKIEKQSCINKDFYKKCYRLLAKTIHPDNSDGDIEAMKCLNQLKAMWVI